MYEGNPFPKDGKIVILGPAETERPAPAWVSETLRNHYREVTDFSEIVRSGCEEDEECT